MRHKAEKAHAIPTVLMLGHGSVGKTTIVKQFKATSFGISAGERADALNVLIKSLVVVTLDVCHTLCDDFEGDGGCVTNPLGDEIEVSDEILAHFETVSELNAQGKIEVYKPIENTTGVLKSRRSYTMIGSRRASIMHKSKKKKKIESHELQNAQRRSRRQSMDRRKLRSHEERIPALKEALSSIWADEEVLQVARDLALEHQGILDKHLLHCNTKICLEHLPYIFDMGYEIDDADYLAISNPTQSMQKCLGTTIDNEVLQLVDVGGQIHFQTEWDSVIKQFKNGAGLTIVFIASLADFSYNEPQGNRLLQSMETWKKLLHNKSVEGVPIVLLLNKDDVFRSRLSTSSVFRLGNSIVLEKTTAENGADFTERCANMIIERFDSIFKDSPQADSGHELGSYRLEATDGGMVKRILTQLAQPMITSTHERSKTE